MTDDIATIFADFDNAQSPGATVAVIREGEIVESRSFGMANIEHGIPNSGDTIFYIASTTKQFVAAAIAMLEADGKLSLEDDIRKFFPKMHEFDPPILVHHLVHHTSGLRDKYALGGVGGLREEIYTTDAPSLRLLERQKTINFPAGSRFMYSNSGYFLMAQIVERVSGQTLTEFARERIFDPLGMKSTMFRADPSIVLACRASGYRRAEDGWRLADYTWQSLGPGGIVTTVDDLAKWDANFYNCKLTPADLPERLRKTRPLTDGSKNAYAFGLGLGERGGHRYESHGGGVMGFGCDFVRFPERKLSVIVLGNTSAIGAQQKALQVADLYLPASDNAKVTVRDPLPLPRDTSNFEGEFLDPDEVSVFRITKQEGNLVLAAGPVNIPLALVDDNKLASQNSEFEFDEFGFAAGGRRFTRLPAGGYKVTDPARYAGEFFSEELESTMYVEDLEAGLHLRRWLEESRPLRAVTEELFLVHMQAYGMTLEIPVRFRLSQGKATHLELSVDRALRNVFERKS